MKKIKHDRPYSALLARFTAASAEIVNASTAGNIPLADGRKVDAAAFRRLATLSQEFNAARFRLLDEAFEACAVEALQLFDGDELGALQWLGVNVHTDRQPGLVYVPAFGSRCGKGSQKPAYHAALVRCGIDPAASVTRACPR